MKSHRQWLFEPLALKLFVLVSVLVLCVFAPAAYFLVNRHFNSALTLKRNETYLQDHVIAIALEHQMLENRRDLITAMIQGFSSDPRLKRLLVVDNTGRVRLTNDPAFANRVFERGSPTCQACHAVPSPQRQTSALIDLEGGRVLRSVYPLRNQEACHRCHNPTVAVNGVLITDTDLSDLRAGLRAQVLGMLAVVGASALVLLVGITAIVRLLVLRRLARIEASTRAIRNGHFDRRVDVSGTDAVARLGTEFNQMADSVADLLSQLRNQRTQLENVMSSVDDGLLVIDRTFSVVALNASLAQRIGTSREALLYRRCFEMWSPDCGCASGDNESECPARACFETGGVHRSLRTRYAADGAVREEEVFASPILGADGEVAQVVEVWRDITERKSREARMAEFQRLVSLGMLASGFSHEVNTPLATMLVHVDEARRFAGGSPTAAAELRGPLEIIRGEILRCREITQQFLQLSRGNSMGREILELPSVVRSTLPLVAHVAKAAGVTVRAAADAAPAIVLANEGAVRQVLLNILLNAVQASRAGGEVRVAWTANSSVSLRIEDDGVGMPPDVRERVFEPFFSRRPSGTGLGLFVSINLARQWGGNIVVSSEPGRGSAFDVMFPPVEAPCATNAF